MPEQLDMHWDGASTFDALSNELIDALAETIATVGLKEAAYQLDTSPSYLANCLRNRQRAHLRIEWIPYLLYSAPSPKAIRLLAELCGYELVPKKRKTPEERLAALEKALGESFGPDVRRAIYEKAGL